MLHSVLGVHHLERLTSTQISESAVNSSSPESNNNIINNNNNNILNSQNNQNLNVNNNNNSGHNHNHNNDVKSSQSILSLQVRKEYYNCYMVYLFHYCYYFNIYECHTSM